MTTKQHSHNIERRSFLKCFLAAGALTIVAPSASALRREDGLDTSNPEHRDHALGPFVRIFPDGSVEIGAPSAEIGTGLHTSLPMLVAEELDADWKKVTVKQMMVHMFTRENGRPGFKYVRQGGGGSATFKGSMPRLQAAGAEARYRLIQAAAARLNVNSDTLTTEVGNVVHASSGRSLPYQDLLSDAVNIQSPKEAVPLKKPETYKIVGHQTVQKGLRDVVTGQPNFGLDAEYPGMVHAVIARSPYPEGHLVSVDSTKARSVEGVIEIVELDRPDTSKPYTYQEAGVAVVADSVWNAMKARDLLEIKWLPENKGEEESTSRYETNFEDCLSQNKCIERVIEGDAIGALSTANKVVTADFDIPFLSHATMEPQNAIAYWKETSVDIITPSQSLGGVVAKVAQYTNLKAEDIHVKPMRAGGSFGRRLQADAVLEAVALSKKLNKPVKVTWSREDDMRHDFYMSTSRQRITAGVDENGKIIAWHHQMASTTTDYRHAWSRDGEEWRDDVWEDLSPRRLIPNFKIDHALVKSRVPRGAWRGPLPTRQAFPSESMFNKIAHETGQDPLDFRLKLYSPGRPMEYKHWGNFNNTWNTANMLGVLNAAAEKADWYAPRPAGVGRGIASYFVFGSYCAIIVDVKYDKNARMLQILKAVAAVDCGKAMNPSGVRSQIEGGMIDGFSTALNLKITTENGVRQQGNFDSYPLLRMDQSPPEIDVVIVEPNDGRIEGTGETATPVAIPALLEAIFQATGKRIVKLPVGDQLDRV
ncbi:MAG: molybdopterin cofactor-binding domain-containing protein [Kordiimonas sp.]